MILDITKGNEWQFLSKDGSCILPWYTRPALDYLESMYLKNKIVWEYGLGLSTIWYARNALDVYGVDGNIEWFKNIRDTLKDNLYYPEHLYFTLQKEYYVGAMEAMEIDFDIIVIDGLYRDECFMNAIKIAKKGVLIIFDNWMQESVGLQNEEVQNEVKKHPHYIFEQEEHPDWKTLILIKYNER